MIKDIIDRNMYGHVRTIEYGKLGFQHFKEWKKNCINLLEKYLTRMSTFIRSEAITKIRTDKIII